MNVQKKHSTANCLLSFVIKYDNIGQNISSKESGLATGTSPFICVSVSDDDSSAQESSRNNCYGLSRRATQACEILCCFTCYQHGTSTNFFRLYMSCIYVKYGALVLQKGSELGNLNISSGIYLVFFAFFNFEDLTNMLN